MAMFPNATHGYMPFVHGKNTQTKNKRSHKPHVNGGKLHHRTENRRHVAGTGLQKMYQITLKDKKGQTYKCIVKTDGSTSLPELCEARLGSSAAATHKSMPNLGSSPTVTSPAKQRKVLAEKFDALNSYTDNGENYSGSLDLRNCGKKEGLFSAFIRFIKEKTGKSDKDTTPKAPKHKGGKSKRKPRDLSQRKRQRTVSAMSNLDPIAESPNEHEFEDDDDSSSYNHFSSSCSSDSESLASSVSIEEVEAERTAS